MLSKTLVSFIFWLYHRNIRTQGKIVYWPVTRLNIHVDNTLFHYILKRSDTDQNLKIYLVSVTMPLNRMKFNKRNSNCKIQHVQALDWSRFWEQKPWSHRISFFAHFSHFKTFCFSITVEDYLFIYTVRVTFPWTPVWFWRTSCCVCLGCGPLAVEL